MVYKKLLHFSTFVPVQEPINYQTDTEALVSSKIGQSGQSRLSYCNSALKDHKIKGLPRFCSTFRNKTLEKSHTKLIHTVILEYFNIKE